MELKFVLLFNYILRIHQNGLLYCIFNILNTYVFSMELKCNITIKFVTCFRNSIIIVIIFLMTIIAFRVTVKDNGKVKFIPNKYVTWYLLLFLIYFTLFMTHKTRVAS